MTFRLVTAALIPALLAVASAEAALPPYWERAAEIRAILDDRQVAAALQDRPVERIERLAERLYRLWAENCRLDVRTVVVPPAMPGPATYRIEVGTPRLPMICRLWPCSGLHPLLHQHR